LSGSRTLFSKTRRGKLESVVDTILLEDSVVAKDFVLALERDDFLDCDELDFGFFPDFLPCPPIFSNVFKFSFVKRARFGGLLAPVSIDLSGLRFRLRWLLVCGRPRYS
jgi:hypothetical protein